jgi:ankyrin repeat protein
MAARMGCHKCVVAILAAGANAKSTDMNGYTPLHDITMHRNQLQVQSVIQCLSKQANLEAEEKHGWTPLYCAVANDNLAAIVAFADEGADINTTKQENQAPPIGRAISMNFLAILKFLCRRGASFSWAAAGPFRNVLDELVHLDRLKL